MAWTVELDPAAEKDLNNLDPQQAKRILRFLFERVAHLDNPRRHRRGLKRIPVQQSLEISCWGLSDH